MKLFHWNRAESLENYACGDIIVMAEDVESARSIALQEFWRYAVENESSKYRWMFDMNGKDYTEWEDEDDRKEFEEWLDTFKRDLIRTPEEKIAAFIQGSS